MGKKSLSTGQAWFLLLAGLVLGTVFVFGMQYWKAPVAQEEAVYITAEFSSFEERPGRGGGTRGIDVFFADHEALYIDGSCVDDELRRELDGVRPGEELMLMVHPNSDTILDMRSEDTVLMEFGDISKTLARERYGFQVLGLLFYVGSLAAIIRLISYRRHY